MLESLAKIFNDMVLTPKAVSLKEVTLTDKTHFRGRWKNSTESWVKQTNMPEKVVRYIVDYCKLKDTPADIQQSIKQNIFK